MSETITVLVNRTTVGPRGQKLVPGRIVELEDSEYVTLLLASGAVDLIDPPYYDKVAQYRRSTPVRAIPLKPAKKAEEKKDEFFLGERPEGSMNSELRF